MSDVAKHVIYRGRVQGVGFRFTTRQIAGRYGLAGFVRNLPDGTVEMFIRGDADDVNRCLGDIGEAFAGYIRDAEIEDALPDERYDGFSINF
ncbi:MAG TPA: acylphosphatase [Planctomycetes bacterium]|nr:acylphosphatase [Planctomycetota bacterium]